MIDQKPVAQITCTVAALVEQLPDFFLLLVIGSSGLISTRIASSLARKSYAGRLSASDEMLRFQA